MKRFRLASVILIAALAPAALSVAQTGTGSGGPPPSRPGGAGSGGGLGSRDSAPPPGREGAGQDGLRGPRVPGEAGDGSRGFGGDRRGERARGAPDERAWLQALEQIQPPIAPEQKEKIHQIREAFRAKVKEWQDAHVEEMRQLQRKMGESRRAGSAPDPALARRMQEIQSLRPKFDAVQRQIMELLTDVQKASHRKAVEEIMKSRSEGGGLGAGGVPGMPAAPQRGERGARPPGDRELPGRPERPERVPPRQRQQPPPPSDPTE